MLRNSKTKGVLSPREVEAAWRRKLIDRLAGLEIDAPASQFDTRQPRQVPLGSNRERLVPTQIRGLRDVIRPALVARGIRNDIQKLTRGSRHPSKGAKMLAVSLSSAVLTGLIWVSAYVVITDGALGVTKPVEAAFASLFATSKGATAPQQVASVAPAVKLAEIAISDADLDLTPVQANTPADAEAFPAPGLPAIKVAASPEVVTPVMEPIVVSAVQPQPSAAPTTSAAIPAVAPTPVAAAPERTPAVVAAASPRDQVLAMLKSTEDTVANTIGHLDAKAAPAAPNAVLAASAVKIATVRHRIRTRIVHAQPSGTDGLAQGLMALGGGATNVKSEVLPWQKARAQPQVNASGNEVLPWLADAATPAAKPAALKKGRLKSKVFRAAAASTAQVLPTPGEMAFVAPSPTKAKTTYRRAAATKSPTFLQQLINGIDQLTTVSSKHN